MSDPTLSDIDSKNKMNRVWLPLILLYFIKNSQHVMKMEI